MGCHRGGKLQTKNALEEHKKAGEGLRSLLGHGQTEEEVRMSEALAKAAAEHGIESVTAIALAYVMSKAPYVFPMVGGRKVEHLKDNVQALKIRLTPDKIAYLESVKPFDVGFPQDFLGEDPHLTGKTAEILAGNASLSWVRSPAAIGYEGK